MASVDVQRGKTDPVAYLLPAPLHTVETVLRSRARMQLIRVASNLFVTPIPNYQQPAGMGALPSAPRPALNYRLLTIRKFPR